LYLELAKASASSFFLIAKSVVFKFQRFSWRKTCNEKLQSTSVLHPKPREKSPALLNKKTIAGFWQKKRG